MISSDCLVALPYLSTYILCYICIYLLILLSMGGILLSMMFMYVRTCTYVRVCRAAFQYGVKMNEGRKTRRSKGGKNDMAKINREWQQISAVSCVCVCVCVCVVVCVCEWCVFAFVCPCTFFIEDFSSIHGSEYAHTYMLLGICTRTFSLIRHQTFESKFKHLLCHFPLWTQTVFE